MFTTKELIVTICWSLFAYIVFGNIVSKAGYPRWRSLIYLVPLLNIVALIAFAFSHWPIEDKVLELEFRNSR